MDGTAKWEFYRITLFGIGGSELSFDIKPLLRFDGNMLARIHAEEVNVCETFERNWYVFFSLCSIKNALSCHFQHRNTSQTKRIETARSHNKHIKIE